MIRQCNDATSNVLNKSLRRIQQDTGSRKGQGMDPAALQIAHGKSRVADESYRPGANPNELLIIGRRLGEIRAAGRVLGLMKS